VKLATLQVLSDRDIESIHEATVHILEHVGVKVGSRRMFGLLRDRGLPVDPDSRVVRFPRSCVEATLETIPSEFEVHDRSGRPAFLLGDGNSKIAAGHNAVFWLDSETGERRLSTCEDVAMFARICQHLQHLDMIGLPVMPQDVPQHASLLHGLRAVIENSDKPVFFSTDKVDANRACIEMLRAAFDGDLGTHVYGISQLSPTSPLGWEGGVLEAILDTLTTGVPLAILPEPNAGVSAPFTLAGLLTVNNAECLSGLAMTQLLKPGHKVMYANSWTTTDMRTGAALVGSVETSICRIAGAQLARHYGVPSHTTAPNSDNHAHDEQNAWEKTLSTFCSVAAGNDLVVNCGMFATGMTCSHEQLVMDEEISALSRRLARGLEVNADTIARDLVEETGPEGPTYMTADHTLQRLRSGEYHLPSIAVRGPFATWQAAGSPDTAALARAKARDLAARPVPDFASERRDRLAEIIPGFGS
jgi:trimethylamine--corrinoid protein Co-methyltransferase